MSNSNRSYFREQQLCKIEAERPAIQSAADERGLTLIIHNDGQHWQFSSKRRLVDWWPGSGKVAIDKRFDEMKQADSAAQIIAILGPVSTPAPVAPPTAPPPSIAAILDAFDFTSLAFDMKARGQVFGSGLRTRQPGAMELRELAGLILTGCGVGPVCCGGLVAERVDGVLRLGIDDRGVG